VLEDESVCDGGDAVCRYRYFSNALLLLLLLLLGLTFVTYSRRRCIGTLCGETLNNAESGFCEVGSGRQ